MRKRLTLPVLLIAVIFQTQAQETRFGKKELLADLSFLRQQVMNAHADPLRELDVQQWNTLFTGMQNQLTDSMSIASFYAVIKPAVAYLSDEHADVSPPAYFQKNAVFPPFSLHATANGFLVDTVLNGAPLHKGERITAINRMPVAKLIKDLTRYTTGFANERNEKAPEQFGYLYALAHPYEKEWTVTLDGQREVTVTAATFKQWADHMKTLYGPGTDKKEMSYQTIGKTGYLIIPAFAVRNDSDEEAYRRAIDSFFTIAAHDRVKNFVIDVSRNSGGNSIVGGMLIDHFYSKPYNNYQMNWRRSDEYLDQLKKWGINDSEYAAVKPGGVIHRKAEITRPSSTTPKFKGKVYVVVGNGTFSSAIMFATTVKDNKMATLIGQTPRLGHPTHFGELYGGRLPNTQLQYRFGVKEWIRPAGTSIENVLTPDILLGEVSVEEVIKKIGG